MIDPTLIEGVDYSFLFYGGSNLAQHSYEVLLTRAL